MGIIKRPMGGKFLNPVLFKCLKLAPDWPQFYYGCVMVRFNGCRYFCDQK